MVWRSAEQQAGDRVRRVRIGVISDTHGLLRPEAADRLRGSDHILHAGDIGKPAVAEALRLIAPVTAIRGNVDEGHWAREFPEDVTVELGGRRFHMLHDRNEFRLDTGATGLDAVISGHSHRPSLERISGVLYLNPGSAGPRRFRLPVTVARIQLTPTGLEAQIDELLA